MPASEDVRVMDRSPAEQNDRHQIEFYRIASGPANPCEGIPFVARAYVRGILTVTRRAI
jgi:hypothetical protein